MLLNEPQPEQLKRCEVCNYYRAREVQFIGAFHLCELKMDDDTEPSTFYSEAECRPYECPPERTCKNWTWDRHDTKGGK